MLLKTSTAATGGKVIKVGLCTQIVFFGFFILTSILFHVRMSRSIALNKHQILHDVPWKRHQGVLYFGSVLIFVRSVFRLIEYSVSYDTTLYKHEWWCYVFDATLMTLTMLAFDLVHPGQIKSVLRDMKHNEQRPEAKVLLSSYPAPPYPAPNHPAVSYPTAYDPAKPYPATAYEPTNV
jgi:RTA1 like protein